MMFHASLLTRLCVDSFLTAVYLINQMPLSIIGKLSPYQHLFNNEPNCEEFGILSCRCFPYLEDYSKIKFDKKSYPRVFFGYSPLYKGYRCLNPQTNRVYISRHVIVYKTIFPFANNNSFSIVWLGASEIVTFPSSDDWLACTEGKWTITESLSRIFTTMNMVVPCATDLYQDNTLDELHNSNNQPKTNSASDFSNEFQKKSNAATSNLQNRNSTATTPLSEPQESCVQRLTISQIWTSLNNLSKFLLVKTS